MAEDESRPHLRIPIGNVRVEPIQPTGGGETFERADYTDHGRNLARQVELVSTVMTLRRDSSLTHQRIVQIKTPASVPIKRHVPKLNNLGFDILSFSPDADNIAVAQIPRNELESLRRRVTRYAEEPAHPGKSSLSVIEEVAEVPIGGKIAPNLRAGEEGSVECMITLYNSLARRDKTAIAQSIQGVLLDAGVGQVKQKTFASGATVLVADLELNLAREIGTEYFTIRSISPNRTILIGKSYPTQEIPNPLEVSPPIADCYVAVVDSGIKATSPALNGLVGRSMRHLPPGSVGQDFAHGTLVASRVVYGDGIDSAVGHRRLVPNCRLMDVPVFGVDHLGRLISPKEDELITILDQVVPEVSRSVKVFNLSLGSSEPIGPNRFSLVANEIDYLSKRYGVLFVVACGNIMVPRASYPDHFQCSNARIQPPADSLLALSVGSLAKHSDVSSLARANEISPFSCIGPEADGGVKPEVVAHGGNLARGWVPTPRLGAYGVDETGDRLAYDVGTSLAAPVVSGYAAQLFDAYPGASSNIVKALLIHFASSAVLTPDIGIEGRVFYGFGEPQLSLSMEGRSNSVAYLYEGNLGQDCYQHIRFHVPESLALPDSDGRLMIKVTLVYDPPVNPDNQLEYSKSRVTTTLFKNTCEGLREVSVGTDGRNYRLPWNPVTSIQHGFSKGFASGEWELRLRLYVRGRLPEGFCQSYAVIVEVMDTTGTVAVYRDVLAEYGKIYVPAKIGIAA